MPSALKTFHLAAMDEILLESIYTLSISLAILVILVLCNGCGHTSFFQEAVVQGQS